jgi:glycosyltransferase involved in cell wall biosynthesis
VIAAHIPADETDFFEQVIRPRIDGRLVNFVGEVGPEERSRLLGGALALLQLVTVPEPFGLSMAEALACGTPVIGFGLGSVPEVVSDGETGFVVQTLDEAAAAIGRLAEIDRRRCRQQAEERFSPEEMVEGYLDVYQQLVGDRR